MRCSGLCPRRPRGLVRTSSGAPRVETRDMWMLPRDVTEKALLSSAGVEFVVLCCYAFYPSNSTRWFGLVGVEARVQVRARAGREVTSAIQEMFKRATRVKSQ